MDEVKGAVQDNTDTAAGTEESTKATSTTKTTETKETDEQKTDKAADTKDTSDAKDDAGTATEIDPAKFTLPEGFAGMDQEALQEFLPFARELKLTQDQAQQVVSLHAKAMQNAVKKMDEQQAAASEAGAAEVKALFGTNYEQNMGKIQHLLREYGGEDAVGQQVYGNKVIMKTLLKIAEAAGPGRFIAGKQSGTTRDADLLFDAKGD